MANIIGEKELRTDCPFETGLTANTKHEGRQRKLIYEKSFIESRKKELID